MPGAAPMMPWLAVSVNAANTDADYFSDKYARAIYYYYWRMHLSAKMIRPILLSL